MLAYHIKLKHTTLTVILVIGPRILVYIFIENQQMHQNYHFIFMLGQTLLHVSAYQLHHQGAYMILTSCLYVGVHYKKNNGISSEVAAISIVTLWINVDVVNRCWKQRLTTSTFIRHISSLGGSYKLPDDGDSTPKHVGAFDQASK
jgi:hypothetical protein